MNKLKFLIKKNPSIYLFLRKPFLSLTGLTSFFEVVNGQTYYPEKNRKNKSKRIFDNLKWLLKYGEVNQYYNLYGFDCNVVDYSYYPYTHFMANRDRTNYYGNPLSRINILRDKFLFYKYMKASNLPVPKIFGLRIGGVFYNSNMSVSDFGIKGKRDYFVKDLEGEAGKSVKHIKDYSEFVLYEHEIKDVNVIFQERINQHPLMSMLNPHSTNSLRIVTVNQSGNLALFATICRIGTKDSAERDNTCQGGIGVGVNDDGTLMEYGVRKPQYGGLVKKHPDTGVDFSTFRIPYYKEAIEKAFEAHRLFPDIRSIGWDVAITEEGPIFIEGNDNWEIQTIQAIYGGERNKLEEIFK